MSNQSPQLDYNDRLIRLFENQTDPICVMDLQGCILYANQALLNRLGYVKEELVSINFGTLISSEDGLEIFQYYFHKGLLTDSQEFIAEIKAKDGKNIEMKITTVSNEVEGQIKSTTAFLTDVTTQTSANVTTSMLTKGLCESFIEHNRDPILLLDLDAVIVLANRSFSDLLGWRKENLEGFHILQCPSIPADLIEQMEDYFRRVVHGETKLEILETVRMDTEGKSHFMKLSITPISDAQDEVCNWAVHLRDITAQIKAEQALLQLDYGKIPVVLDQVKSRLKSLKQVIESIKLTPGFITNDYPYVAELSEEVVLIENLIHRLSTVNQNYDNSLFSKYINSAI